MDRETALRSLDWLVAEGHRTSASDMGYNGLYAMYLDYDNLSGLEQAAYGENKEDFDDIVASVKKLSYNGTDALIPEEDIDAVATLSAWDYDRLVTVARWCYSLEYITEDEMYAYAEFAAEQAVQEYANWNQYFAAVIIGRTVWSGERRVAGDEERPVAYALLHMQNSIYQKVPFFASGGGEAV